MIYIHVLSIRWRTNGGLARAPTIAHVSPEGGAIGRRMSSVPPLTPRDPNLSHAAMDYGPITRLLAVLAVETDPTTEIV